MDVTARLEEMQSALGGLETLIPDWIREECEGAAVEIADLNRERLMEGKAMDGSAISPFYAPYTVAYKRRRGGVADRVTLYDYGAFHASLRCVFGGDSFTVESTDADAAKVDWLLEHYPGQVLGFSEEDKAFIADIIVAEPLSRRVSEYIKQ